MGSATGAAAWIGRVGALAVALGVGAAVATTPGVAWADDTGSGESAPGPAQGGADADDRDTDSGSGRGFGKPRRPGQLLESIGNSIAEHIANPRLRPVRVGAGRVGAGQTEPADDGAPDRLPDEIPDVPDERGHAPAPARPESARLERNRSPLTLRVPSSTAPEPEPVATPEPSGLPTSLPTTVVGGGPTAAIGTVPVGSPEPAASSTPAAPALLVAVPGKAAVPAVRHVVRQVTSGLLAVFGAGSAAGNGTGTPADSPAAWALLAFARRELGTTRSAQAPSRALAAVLVVPERMLSSQIGWVTGPNSPNNTINVFNIYGTDLGIMWDGGTLTTTGERFVHVAFGDTFSGPNMTGDWRSNVLLISTDRNLTDGLGLNPTGPAYQFIPSNRGALSWFFPTEVTIIPTAGIHAGGTQYVGYMSVRSWDTPGRWTTNYSGVAVYNPVTDRWVLAPTSVRSSGWLRSSTPYRPGDQNFQQYAFVLQPEDQVEEGQPRYVYAFGTPSGRAGSAYLARVPEGSVADLSQWEYWDGSTWVKDRPVAAVAVLGDSDRSAGLFGFIIDWANDPNVFCGYLGGLFGAKTGGNISELSVQYNEYLDKYIVMYANGSNDVVLRYADSPEGPWSDPIIVATSAQYPGLYAPMIHPWSGTGMLVDDNGEQDVSNLYWNMSLWNQYNVVLMKTDLSPLREAMQV